MPFKPQAGGRGYTLDPLRELSNSGTEFNYRAEVIVRVASIAPAPETEDEFEERVARAIERRRRKQNG